MYHKIILTATRYLTSTAEDRLQGRAVVAARDESSCAILKMVWEEGWAAALNSDM